MCYMWARMVHVVDHAPNAHVTCDTHRYTDIYMIYVYVQVCLGRCAPVNNIYIHTHKQTTRCYYYFDHYRNEHQCTWYTWCMCCHVLFNVLLCWSTDILACMCIMHVYTYICTPPHVHIPPCPPCMHECLCLCKSESYLSDALKNC